MRLVFGTMIETLLFSIFVTGSVIIATILLATVKTIVNDFVRPAVRYLRGERRNVE